MKGYVKIKESSYLEHWEINNIYGWSMSKKWPVDSFKWVEDLCEVDEGFIKSYNENSKEGNFWWKKSDSRIHLTFLITLINFILLLRKSFCTYEYMDEREKFNEASLPEKEDLCSNLNMEDITNLD